MEAKTGQMILFLDTFDHGSFNQKYKNIGIKTKFRNASAVQREPTLDHSYSNQVFKKIDRTARENFDFPVDKSLSTFDHQRVKFINKFLGSADSLASNKKT